MGELIEFPEKKEPTIAGQAVCICCKYEWLAAADVGTYQLDCPSCGSSKGIFKHPVQRSGMEWSCGCGNDLFRISKGGIYCPNCGAWQVFPL